MSLVPGSPSATTVNATAGDPLDTVAVEHLLFVIDRSFLMGLPRKDSSRDFPFRLASVAIKRYIRDLGYDQPDLQIGVMTFQHNWEIVYPFTHFGKADLETLMTRLKGTELKGSSHLPVALHGAACLLQGLTEQGRVVVITCPAPHFPIAIDAPDLLGKHLLSLLVIDQDLGFPAPTVPVEAPIFNAASSPAFFPAFPLVVEELEKFDAAEPIDLDKLVEEQHALEPDVEDEVEEKPKKQREKPVLASQNASGALQSTLRGLKRRLWD